MPRPRIAAITALTLAPMLLAAALQTDTSDPQEVSAERATPIPGKTKVVVADGGEVLLDGEPVGTVPPGGTLVLTGVVPGEHSIALGESREQVEVEPRRAVRVVLVGGAEEPPVVPPVPPGGDRAGIDWVRIPAGKRPVPSDGGLPGEATSFMQVRPFEIARTEVTVAQYRACVEAEACAPPDVGEGCNWLEPDHEEHPVNCVDWHQAREFARWAGGRLPTEVEWELAASGRQKYSYAGSNDVGEVAWYRENSASGTRAVCGKKSNGRGLCDMSGNVQEWVEGVHPLPAGSPAEDDQGGDTLYEDESWMVGEGKWAHMSPRGIPTELLRRSELQALLCITRGGAWVFDAASSEIDSRFVAVGGAGDAWTGLRIVR